MNSEFEEKQFEQHLNFELLRSKNLFYPPGQVLEHTLGFDVALFSDSPDFWKLFSSRKSSRKVGASRPGVKLQNKWWKKLNQQIENFPPFKFNVFVQHKRPDYLTTAHSKEWSDWNGAYYRYGLVSHQQKALEKLEDKIKDKGIVVYACPAFSKLSDLWNAIKSNSLITQTNFVRPSRLKGHKLYTYQYAGNNGKAYSDPKDIEFFDILEHIQFFSRIRARKSNNRAFLIEIGNNIHEFMEKKDELSFWYREIISFLSKDIDVEVARAMIRIDAFCFLKNTTWKIGI